MTTPLGRTWLAEIERIQAPRRQMMDDAARCVLALGYEPSECLLQMRRGTERIDEPSVEVDCLFVLGEPCFEVTVTRTPFVDWTCTYTTTPRLIAWPPARPPTAPQVPRAPSGGETQA